MLRVTASVDRVRFGQKIREKVTFSCDNKQKGRKNMNDKKKLLDIFDLDWGLPYLIVQGPMNVFVVDAK